MNNEIVNKIVLSFVGAVVATATAHYLKKLLVHIDEQSKTTA